MNVFRVIGLFVTAGIATVFYQTCKKLRDRFDRSAVDSPNVRNNWFTSLAQFVFGTILRKKPPDQRSPKIRNSKPVLIEHDTDFASCYRFFESVSVCCHSRMANEETEQLQKQEDGAKKSIRSNLLPGEVWGSVSTVFTISNRVPMEIPQKAKVKHMYPCRRSSYLYALRIYPQVHFSNGNVPKCTPRQSVPNVQTFELSEEREPGKKLEDFSEIRSESGS